MSDNANELAQAGKREVKVPEGVERISERKAYVPHADIYETAGEVVLLADLPGVDEKGVEITVEKNILNIRGRPSAAAQGKYALEYCEYEPGDYERAFTLGDEVDVEKVSASIRDGVLKVALPKRNQRSFKIAVKAE